MKNLLLFPPLWQPTAPPLGIPCLVAQLKKEKFKIEAIDLNIEFYNDILKRKYLEESIKNIRKIYQEIPDKETKYNIKTNGIQDDELQAYPIGIQEIILKNKRIKEYVENKSHLLNTIPKSIEKAIKNIKNPNSFYDPDLYIKSSNIIHSALDIASLPYAPASIILYGYKNPLLNYDYESIKYNVFSESTNIFANYYKKWVTKIAWKKPEYIGISINVNSQVIPGLTLSYLLKKHTKAHINIGGNYFSRIIDGILQTPEFFDIFADSILTDEGEKPIVELIKHIDNKISIDEVPNLIYKKNNKIIVNKKCEPYKLDELPSPDFGNFKLSQYITPEVVLPVETSRGCYWGKCTFCDIPYGKELNVKNADKFVKELKEYNQKHGITNFNIIDDSIHPSYLNKMSDKIIENELKINYMFCGRTENEFTKEILDKARQSGLRIILWGVEFGSRRVLEYSNKGIDFDNRFNVLQNSSDSDIWNHALLIYGLPTETIDEAKETIEMIIKHSDIINSNSFAPYVLSNESIINKNPQKYGVTNVDMNAGKFATGIKYEATGMSPEEIGNILQIHSETNKKVYGKPVWFFLNRPHTFLYITHHGKNWLKNYKL